VEVEQEQGRLGVKKWWKEGISWESGNMCAKEMETIDEGD